MAHLQFPRTPRIQARALACLGAALLVLAGCGGSEDTAPPVAQAAAALSTRALVARSSAAATVEPEEAARQLFEFAEVYYPEFFPGQATTASALGYLYRYYEGTGIYLGVREGQVYVMGGLFGSEPSAVGALTSFITPRARTQSQLCASGSGVASYTTPAPVVGKNLALTVAGCAQAITTAQWRQTAGPSLPLPADKTQTLSLDPAEPGSYGFEVVSTDSTGAPRTENLVLQVAPKPAGEASLTLRASHSVRMGSKVSLRAWPSLPAGDSIKAVRWTQIEGPVVELDTRSQQQALFTAPEVARDTLIRLRATLYTAQGHVDSDEASVLVERYAQAATTDSNAMWAGDHIARTYAYKPSGRYAGALRRCVYDPAIYHSGPRYNVCNLSTLPFIAQQTGGGIPSVEQVMDRVLVSHDWLGRNFENFLRTHDGNGDMRRMLNSVTVIVLSTHIRPSFYYAGTGAIYLDGNSFWITPEERDTMNEAPDYRSDFGSDLQFETLWRYVKDNQRIFKYYDPTLRITRTLDDVRNEATWLMFHELSHALDFMPPTAYGSLQNNRSVWDNIYSRYANLQLTSDSVPASYPLTSDEMAGLGQVMFQGATATTRQKAYTPLQVADFFSTDLATDDYAYSTSREDIAMTLEEFLMQRRQGIRRDMAISDVYGSEATSATIIVRWGQRGRIGEEAIKPRTRAIVSALTPWAGPSEVDLLPPPLQLRPGESWAANLEQPSAAPRKQTLAALPTLQQWQQMKAELQHMQQRHRGDGKPLPPPPAGWKAAPAP